MTKAWPKRELAGLTARQLSHATRLIPIWHGLEIVDDVLRFSPPLADIKAVRSDSGIETIVREISRVVPISSSAPMDQTIEEAQKTVDRADYDFSIQVAFIAFGRRMIRLIDQLRQSSVLSSEYRIAALSGCRLGSG
jgi:hypothetical protein